IVTRRDEGGTAVASMEEFLPEVCDEFGVKEKDSYSFYYFSKNDVHSELERYDVENSSIRFGAKTGLEDHVNILSGRMYNPAGIAEDGVFEVVISQSAMTNLGLLMGETLEFNNLKDFDGNPIKLRVVGVFTLDNSDYYWQSDSGYPDDMLYISMDAFRRTFTGDKAGKYTYTCFYCVKFEYNDIDAVDVPALYDNTDYYVNRSDFTGVIQKPAYMDVLESYNNKHSRISATLTILQVPVLIMLAAFLLMISGQMYEMEKNEISVIKSRGSSRGQIFRLYLYQAMVLTGVGTLIGIPLGMLMSKMLGAARTFLVFDFNDQLEVAVTWYALIYAVGAIILAMLCLTLPAIKHSKVSIVNLKQQNAVRKKPFWEKMYLDVILTAVSLYGFYNFNRNSASMAESVLNNQSLDPLLYLSSSLMIIGLGLFFLRIKTHVLSGIFKLGKKRWKPASFVSFTENVKNGGKQHLIMLFLIMTISLGMYHSAVAGTIYENAVRNTDYIDGVDMIIKEVWPENVDSSGVPTGVYKEPDTLKYLSADFIKKSTRVINDESAKVLGGQNGGTFKAQLLGISTKEFGEITYVDKYLNKEHYYNYLNKLAKVSAGLLVSSDFRDKLGYKVGDSITFGHGTGKAGTITGQILDFFDYWPGYAPETLVKQPDGKVNMQSNYLIVANYSYILDRLGNYPYEFWIEQREGTDKTDVYNWVKENDVHLKKYMNRAEDMDATRNDPLLQGTNGVLTLGFVVTIVLCGVGYLIYWIMSLKERELVFGVLRASGFHTKELFHMLFNEQVFCGILSVIAGFGIGTLTSKMFVPILQKAYASDSQALPLMLFTNTGDLIRLISVIIGMMVICLFVLTVMLLKMNVTKALKLGED
ncbi:MAG: ABC transporter permease, partial [Lachnospiraceae bacterium]|nr:ABC transporter permease [Lachnospiraceae bacterium]